MANAFIKAERVVRAALGILERESVLARLVWRDAVTDFTGAKNDTVSIRLPAYTTARTRDMRSGDTITVDELSETKVDVTLDTHIYKAVGVSDEEMTLDIVDFGGQVLNPSMDAVVRGIEDALATELTGATYAHTITNADSDIGLSILTARKYLNQARIPFAGRTLAVGADLEVALLDEDKFTKVNESGSDDALREAMLGRIYGFNVVSVPSLAPDEAYAFHRTAFPLVTAAPEVPAGAAWGTRQSHMGLTLRALRDYDFTNVRDRLLTDLFFGTGVTNDQGYYDGDGNFIPSTEDPGAAVTLATSAAADDIIDTATAHGYSAGDRVVFTSLTGGTGLSTNRAYYVIAANLAAQTFQVSETAGGSAVDFSTNVTAGTVREGSSGLLVRAVKLVA